MFTRAAFQFPQSDAIYKFFSGATRSFVRRVTWNKCGPPIPSCIVNSVATVVLCPGCKVAEPTTMRGGQQPSSARTGADASSVKALSPIFVTINSARTIFSKGCLPNSMRS